MPARPAGSTSITSRSTRTKRFRSHSPPTGAACWHTTGRTGGPPMSNPDPVAELAALLGQHGQAEVAYQHAAASADTPARAWEPVLQTLARAYGLAAGLARSEERRVGEERSTRRESRQERETGRKAAERVGAGGP